MLSSLIPNNDDVTYLYLEVCQGVRSAGDDHMSPGGQAPAQQRLHQLQGTGHLPRAVPGIM